AQLVWDQWVGGSNPLSPTNFEPRFGGVFCFLPFFIPVVIPRQRPVSLSRFSDMQFIENKTIIHTSILLSPPGDRILSLPIHCGA
ncbi:hypothetical protein KSU19_19950, partial [Enterobacter quasiroggenkampii]|uniref:hypothetical protein n=1 Tax=Enterobacter quasiroggenkampii TaxID=2497436 RepID=UPI0021CF814C